MNQIQLIPSLPTYLINNCFLAKKWEQEPSIIIRRTSSDERSSFYSMSLTCYLFIYSTSLVCYFFYLTTHLCLSNKTKSNATRHNLSTDKIAPHHLLLMVLLKRFFYFERLTETCTRNNSRSITSRFFYMTTLLTRLLYFHTKEEPHQPFGPNPRAEAEASLRFSGPSTAICCARWCSNVTSNVDTVVAIVYSNNRYKKHRTHIPVYQATAILIHLFTLLIT